MEYLRTLNLQLLRCLFGVRFLFVMHVVLVKGEADMKPNKRKPP